MLKLILSRSLTKRALLVNSIWWTISLIVFAILVGTRTISWNWITGLILGQLATFIGLLVLFYSRELIIKHQNPFLFYFMFLLRLGLYVIPFFLSLLLNDGEFFNYLSILIGLSSILIWPITGYQKTTKNKEMERG